MDMSNLRRKTWQRYECCKEYFRRRIKANSIKETYIGQGLSELAPVEIIGKPNKFGYEVDNAGSPLALDNG